MNAHCIILTWKYFKVIHDDLLEHDQQYSGAKNGGEFHNNSKYCCLHPHLRKKQKQKQKTIKISNIFGPR